MGDATGSWCGVRLWGRVQDVRIVTVWGHTTTVLGICSKDAASWYTIVGMASDWER